ncbi:twin transmembrane helix small protein [Ideonella sp. DXS22W]|uniref:Twin transmembrane helix small protein n=1 Tax=Pseudaquabacterium inlustre TaxID=2984192 RepID=A0ABU9CFZ5_9BURK
MKAVIVIALVFVLVALASAGLFMLRGGQPGDDGSPGQRDKRMARALALRVGLSIALFLFILLSWWMGWVQPSGLPVGR